MRIVTSPARVLSALIVLFSPLLCEAGIGFRFERSFDIPALSQPATQVTFVSGSSGDEPLCLATDGDAIVLFSSRTGEVDYCSRVTQPGEQCRDLRFGDINQDTIPDLIAGLVATDRFRVLVLDGRSHYKDTSSISLSIAVAPYCQQAHSFLTLVDLNGDSLSELLISADTGVAGVKGTGVTRLYSSFPRKVVWSIGRSVRYAQVVTLVDRSRRLYAEPSECERLPYAVTRQINATAQAITIDSSGTVGPVGLFYPSPCGAVPPNYHSVEPSLVLYRHDLSRLPQAELFSIATREFQCGDDTTARSITTLSYSLMHSTLTLEHIWSWDITVPYHDFTFVPGFPDHLFALGGHSLVMFRLSDGSVATNLEHLPAQFQGWVYPATDSIPQLLTRDNRRVALYSLDITTDDPEDGENGLPVRFSILPLYRDDGRVIIPLDIPWSGELSVEVLDQKGDSIAPLLRGQSPQMQHRIEWKMDGLASGIYVIRASFDNQTISRPVLVLR